MEQKKETQGDQGGQIESASRLSERSEVTQPVETTMPELTQRSILDVSIGLNSIAVDDEVILVDVLTNKYFRLNNTGAFILSLVQQQRLSLEELSGRVAQKFHLAPDEASELVLPFVRDMVLKGVISLNKS
jgi:Coenzyme PQQ synthesis protein D (PqqD)